MKLRRFQNTRISADKNIIQLSEKITSTLKTPENSRQIQMSAQKLLKSIIRRYWFQPGRQSLNRSQFRLQEIENICRRVRETLCNSKSSSLFSLDTFQLFQQLQVTSNHFIFTTVQELFLFFKTMNTETGLIFDRFSLCKSRADFFLFTVQSTSVRQFETTGVTTHIMMNTLITLLQVMRDSTFNTMLSTVRTRHNHNTTITNASSKNDSLDQVITHDRRSVSSEDRSF